MKIGQRHSMLSQYISFNVTGRHYDSVVLAVASLDNHNPDNNVRSGSKLFAD